MRPLRVLAGVALALAMVVSVGALSRVPVTFPVADSAMVRLAWRAAGERVRHCRALTPEELARIPAHMRRQEECSDRGLSYRLEVRLDGRLLADHPVHPAGARGDRPMYVFEEWRIPPGEHRLTVRFARAEEPPAGFQAVGETPPVLTLDTALSLAVHQIALVTYEQDAKRLVLVGGTPR